MRTTAATAAAIALALTANDAAAFRLPVTSRAVRTGRRGATVRFATAEELLAQAQALRDEVDREEKELGVGAYAPTPVAKAKEPELPPLSPEEIQQKLLSVAIEAKSADAQEQVATLDGLKESGDLRL